LLGLLAHVAALLFLLHRYGSRLGPLFRVELTSPMPPMSQSPPPAEEPVVIHTRAVGYTGRGETTGESFDLGPSYEEERRQKEEAVQQQEQAVLQQILEQNLRLREQIEHIQGPDESASEPEPHGLNGDDDNG
jgi:hypothetical protein